MNTHNESPPRQAPISIRPIKHNDYQKRHRFFVELSFAQTGMVHSADEIAIHTHETQEKIDDFLRHHRGLWLVAEDPCGEIVGEIDITRKNISRIRHNGQLTIGVLPRYQSRGIGSILMQHAIDWAQKNEILRIELFVFATNTVAQKLYKKFGFVSEGVRHNFLRHHDGHFENDFMMAKYL